jgi:ribosomal protein S18 acetylase RimI-like enzyme
MGYSEMIIRKAEETDIDLICSLGRKTFYETFADQNDHENLEKYLRESFNSQKIIREFKNPDSSFYLHQLDKVVTGYLKVNEGTTQTDYFGPEYLEVERLYVLKEYKGRGIGKSMMKRAFKLASDRGLQYIWLGVWEHNESAKLFYEKMGFEFFGTHIFNVGDDPQTDIILRKAVKSP